MSDPIISPGRSVIARHAAAWRRRTLIAEDVLRQTPTDDPLMVAQAKWWVSVCYEVAEKLTDMAKSIEEGS